MRLRDVIMVILQWKALKLINFFRETLGQQED